MQILQMECERGRSEADCLTDCAGRQSFGTLLDQQSIDPQTIFVRQGTQRFDRMLRFHAPDDITRNVEMSIRFDKLSEKEHWPREVPLRARCHALEVMLSLSNRDPPSELVRQVARSEQEVEYPTGYGKSRLGRGMQQ